MSAQASPARVVSLLALAAIACLAAEASFAQDPRSAAVQQSAREWLGKTDRLDAAASFAAAGDKFRAPITVLEWTDALAKARAPLGAVVQRATMETAFDKASAGRGPEVEIATILYRTSFQNNPLGNETVTLEHEPDGVWRVIGYFIR